MADALNRGKELYQLKGCVGCHRYEGYDRESEGLFNTRQTVKNLEIERSNNLREIDRVTKAADTAASNEEAQRLYARADNLRVSNSQIDAKIDQLQIQARFLMQDQKKIGPNLKEIKVKLKKEWLPFWLEKTHEFRPDTKMPQFRLSKEEVQAISAFLWQSALEGAAPEQQPGDSQKGKQSIESRGCLACHSIEESDKKHGGEFAANLSRLGEKANLNYIVRWISNPRERTRPYCPKEKKDIGPEDYEKKGLPFKFDANNTKCPNCNSEMQVQNMTVMPDFRLSAQEVRDIATYLIQDQGLNKSGASYSDVSFMDDPNLKAKGLAMVKNYGCASCHEIAGLEDAGRIGTELTKEGSKPIERLDFGRLEHDFKHKGQYNHKTFFENKLAKPEIYDTGKEKAPQDRLKMPKPNLSEADISALTTFLLGSSETTMPASFMFNPTDHRKDVQEGMWVIKKYNCMGCHKVAIGQNTILQALTQYQGDGREKLPPRLTSQGARVDPRWLMKFLNNPALSDAETDRNGVRSYLDVRMPTFNFSPNELQALVRFFAAASAQAEPYIPTQLEAISEEEKNLGRQLFTSKAAPCLKCHLTGDAAHDKTASAPNFLIASERLKPEWTARWLLDPALIDPGTAMPSGLFEKKGDRWVLKGELPSTFEGYTRDHVELLVRYMFQLTPDEQRKISAASPGGGPTAFNRYNPRTTMAKQQKDRGIVLRMSKGVEQARARGYIVSH
jgi:mono/diheme cytochrome c family protein